MSRFAPFHRVDVAYRVINGVPIEATILTPLKISKSRENSRTKPQPVLVRWHGGGFIVGHRMYEPWFAQWLLDLAIDHGAIIVTPDYRLLPESNGADILSDVAHFWRWMQRDLAKVMEGENLPRPDLSNVLCCGESSGGFISVYCALHLESMLRAAGGSTDREAVKEVHIRAVISISAPLDATAPEYKIPRPRVFMGHRPPPPRQALSKIRAYIKSMRPGSIRTGCEPTSDMWELLLCIGQQACLPRLFGLGDKEEGVPVLEELMETLERKENPMTPVWLVHGRDDTMVSLVAAMTP